MNVKMKPGTFFLREKDKRVWKVVRREASKKRYVIINESGNTSSLSFGEGIKVIVKRK